MTDNSTEPQPLQSKALLLRLPSFSGLSVAVILICLGFTPSLLPRDWPLQVAVNLLLGCVGYGFGLLMEWLVFKFRRDCSLSSNLKRAIYACLGSTYFVFLGFGRVWHRQARRLVALPPDSPYSLIGITLFTLIGLALALLVARLVIRFLRGIGDRLSTWLPEGLSHILALLIAVYLGVGFLDGFLVERFVNAADKIGQELNDLTEEGIEQPAAPNLSGGVDSLIPWETVGRKGRTFIAEATSLEALEEINKKPALKPIRIYAGVESASTAQKRAELAVEELERTGAFEREVLLLVLPTGTGWINNLAIAPLEFMYNGNTATVALQYSYLPSVLSFLLDEDKAKESGIELFNAVFDEWSVLPPDTRPKLLSYGESLGSFGTEAAFPTASSFRAASDGALLIGPPNANALWSQAVRRRDPGTSMILPIVEQGETVRFASRPGDLSIPQGEWLKPRGVYLQNPSDPIVWWSAKLLYRKPDWLREELGTDINPAVTWIPLVTFVQVSVDLIVARAPAGHGHRYGTLTVNAWAKIAEPPGWTVLKTAALKKIL